MISLGARRAVNGPLAPPPPPPGRPMDLFTQSPKPRKRPSQASDTGRRTKAKTPQATRSESLASNLRPKASREPTDSTRRKPQNAKAGPSKLGKQAEVTATPPTRQSTRVSRPSAKKALAAEIVLSSDEDSDLPSPSSIFKKLPKTPPARPKKRKRASSPVKTQATKISKVSVICLEISDSDDDEQVKTRPLTKRPKVTKNAAPEDVIDLCSSSENEGSPPSSPLAQAQLRKSSPGVNVRNYEIADAEVRKSKKPSREKDVPTPKVADTQSKANPARQASHSMVSPSSPPSPQPRPSSQGPPSLQRPSSPQRSPSPQCPPSPQRLASPPTVTSPPQKPASLPRRLRNMRMQRTRSILSGRKLTRPERENEITYFEPDAQPELTLLTHTFFKKSIAFVKTRLEAQKRKKRKAAMSALASGSTSVPMPHLEVCIPPKTSLKTPSSNTNASSTLTEQPPEPPLQDDNPPGVSVEPTELENVPTRTPEATEPSPVATSDGEAKSIPADIVEFIHSVNTTSNEACEPEIDLIRGEIPEIQDLIASAKHVTHVLDKLKDLKSRSISECSPSRNAQAEPPQRLDVNARGNIPSINKVDRTAVSPSPTTTQITELAPSRRRVPLPTRTSSVPAMKVRQNSIKSAKDASIETPQQPRPQSAPLASSKFCSLSRIVPVKTPDDSVHSQEPSISANTSDTSAVSTTTAATSTTDKSPGVDPPQHQSPPSPASPQAQADCDAATVVSSATKPDAISPALGLDLAALSFIPDTEGESAAYDDMSLSDIELVYPEDLA